MNLLEPNALLIWPVVFNLIVIWGVSLYYSTHSGWSARPNAHGGLHICAHCHRVYEDERSDPRVACPRCGRLNDRIYIADRSKGES